MACIDDIRHSAYNRTQQHSTSAAQIARYSNAQEFLFNVAHARGKLGKGGVPNLTLAARSVIQDWNDGKIPYYTPPPEVSRGSLLSLPQPQMLIVLLFLCPLPLCSPVMC